MVQLQRLSETDKAYFAGLIDSSGSIHVRRTCRAGKVIRREMILNIEPLNTKQLTWIKARFKGATIWFRKSEGRYAVRFGTRWAATALTEVLGHMIAKDAEARLVFKFASAVSRPGKPLTPDQLKVREEVDAQLGAMKRGA